MKPAVETVKWFNTTGFIQPDEGGQDIFIHISAVERAGFLNLQPGSKIGYELVTGRGGRVSADKLRLSGAPRQ